MSEPNVQDLVADAFAQAKDPKVIKAHDIEIRGGSFKHDTLQEFLKTWNTMLARLEWRMYEFVDKFSVCGAANDSALAENVFWKLERARFFGEKGDLEVRRDGEMFYWRYIGENDTNLPVVNSAFGGKDFWDTNSDAKFRTVEKEYYQWREKDERVDSRWLKENNLADEGTYLRVCEYLRAGYVEFVRFLGFGKKEARDANG